MRWLCFLVITFCLTLSCVEGYSEKGPQIIEKSIKAHGGLDVYKKLDGLVLHKTTKLFLEDGSIESEVTQKQSFQFIPHYIVQIEWEANNVSHKLVYNGVEVYVKRNDSMITNPEALYRAQKTIKAAEYVFFQPFKLNDQWTNQDFIRTLKFNDTLEVSEVKISYPENEEADTWWYYFNSEYQNVANKVLHNEKYSLIENLKFQKYKGLLFNKHRKSYFADSLGNKKYLRAEYFYDIVE